MKLDAQGMKHAISILLATCSLSVSAWCAPAAAEETTENRDETWTRARALFEQGAAAFDAGKYEQARWALSESLRLRKSYDTAGLLGQTEIELGHFRDAAEHLDYCIREFPISENRELLKRVQEAFSGVKQRVGTVRVTVDRAGAEVLVDDKPAGTSPLAGDVFVNPGVHQVAARMEGASPVTRAFRIKAGEVERVQLKVSLPDAGLPERSGSNSSPELGGPRVGDDVTQDSPRSSNTKTWVLAGGAGLTVAAVALGIGFRLSANGADNDALTKQRQLTDSFGTGKCNASGVSGSELCNDIRSSIRSRDRFDDMSTVSFIAAGLFGAATVGAYLLWPKQESAIAITPPRVGTGAELHLRTTF